MDGHLLEWVDRYGLEWPLREALPKSPLTFGRGLKKTDYQLDAARMSSTAYSSPSPLGGRGDFSDREKYEDVWTLE